MGRKKQSGGSRRKPTTKKGRREERERKEDERERKEEEKLEERLAEQRRIQGERQLAEMSEFSIFSFSTFSGCFSGERFERLEEERGRHLEEVEEAKVRMKVFDKENKGILGVGGQEGDEETASVVNILSPSELSPSPLISLILKVVRLRREEGGKVEERR